MNNTKILIADENLSGRSALRDELKAQGYANIYEASNGEEALSMIGTVSPDIVLIDLLLSKLDGIGVIRQARKNLGEDAPIFERYFLGGGDSLRGFEFREISPTDKNGVRKGGQTMLLVTSEISHPIWDFIRGAVFVDIGNTWSDSWEFGAVNIGVGYGLRIVLPYLNAPIKLDLAYPVLNEEKGYKSKLRFHFNMGFTF